MKKLSILILLVVFGFAFSNFNVVLADETKVSSVGDGAANYYVEEVIESVELDFGVMYHNDAARLNTADEAYVAAGTYAAGGSAYGKEEFVVGKYYPANVNVLEVPSTEDVDIVPYANIKNGKWTLTTVAGMISNYEATHPDKRVIAAVNGDFFDINANGNYPYCSTGGTVSEGNYFKVNADWKSIAFKNDGSQNSLVGNIMPTISEKPVLQILEDGEVVFEVDVDALNELPGVGGTSVYFTFYDEKHNPNLLEIENAYIVEGSQIAPYATWSVFGLGQVKELASVKLNVNQFAIKTNNNVLKDYLKTGATVRVQYEYVGELADVDNVIGYPANIILDGQAQMFKDYRHPRTMVGARADGTIIITTIDGRQIEKGYYGASPVEQAALMQYYGCTQAYNLDGGGSTTILIRQNGKFVVKNSPSDGSERNDGNCLLIVAEVPEISIETMNVLENSFDIKIDVIEMIDKYKDLYIDVNGEKRKVEDKTMSFTGLDVFTNYVYKLYSLVDGEYVGLPYTGVINTAKGKYEVKNAYLEIVTKEDGKQYYHFSFEVEDNYECVMMLSLRVNGKRVAVQNKEVYIPIEEGCPISELYVVVTYDLEDQKGRVDDLTKEFNMEFSNVDLMIESIFDSVEANLQNMFNK